MNLFSIFIKAGPNRVFISILLSVIAGIAFTILIPLVMGAISGSDPRLIVADNQVHTFLGFEISHYPKASAFLFVCLTILICRTLSQIMLSRISLEVTRNIRLEIYRRISRAPLSDLERIGSPRLIANITSDVPHIVNGASLFPDFISNFVTLLGILGFLVYLNDEVFQVVISAIFFGVLAYQLPILIGQRYFSSAREFVDNLHEAIRGLIYGAKELKLNRNKSEQFYHDVLSYNENQIMKADKVGTSIIMAAVNFGDLLSFFVIGVVAFVFVNYHAISSQELVGVVMALLYLTGPVTVIIKFLPDLTRAKISLNKVNLLLEQIPEEQTRAAQQSAGQWQQVTLSGVCYVHQGSEGSSFEIGPIDLTINAGELVFIVGGNGSGKSTMSKVLTTHYRPTKGELSFDGIVVDDNNLDALRQTICSIYSDYHLFDRLFDTGTYTEQEQRALLDQYLDDFELSHKVSIKDRRFSTLALSDGQRRRLALLVAMVEDKRMYLFDEWAADQDPRFKELFYSKVLSDLKAAGKAVVIITHDDRYFHLADKLVVMENGRIREVITHQPDLSNHNPIALHSI